MKNVEFNVKGKKLTIEVDLSQDFGKSKSGLTTIVATTGGATVVEGETRLNMTVYKKPKKKGD